MLVLMYLAAIVAANTLLGLFGPVMVIPNALIFIGLDLSSRDALHERWQRRHLFLKTLALVGSGALISGGLSLLFSPDAWRISLASFAAFLSAGLMDAAVYQVARRWPFLLKSNASNAVGAVLDSVVFAALVPFPMAASVVLGQIAAKLGGGLVWSFIIDRVRQMTIRRVDPKEFQR